MNFDQLTVLQIDSAQKEIIKFFGSFTDISIIYDDVIIQWLYHNKLKKFTWQATQVQSLS